MMMMMMMMTDNNSGDDVVTMTMIKIAFCRWAAVPSCLKPLF